MPVAAAYMGVFGIGNGDGAADFQALKDCAVFFGSAAVAFLTQRDELVLQGHQAIDACLDVMNVLVDQVVDTLALILRTVAQGQEVANFIQGHVEDAAIAYEGESLDMGLGVEAVVAIAAGRQWQ